MIFLHVFGKTLESSSDSKKMLAAFFPGGIISFPLSFPYFPAGATILEASVAILTLTAVVMLTKPLRFSLFLLMPVSEGEGIQNSQQKGSEETPRPHPNDLEIPLTLKPITTRTRLQRLPSRVD